MSPLKAAVQVAHAAQLARDVIAVRCDVEADLQTWRATGFDVRLVRPDADERAHLATTAAVVVRDAGFTEIPPATRTALALWR